MKNKNPKSTVHYLLSGVLIGVIVAGAATTGIFALKATTYQASSLKSIRTKKLIDKQEKVKVLRITKLKRPVIASDISITRTNEAIRKTSKTNCSYLPPEQPKYSGKFIANKNRVEQKRGEEFAVTLYLENTGNMPWFSDSSGCGYKNPVHLGTAKQKDRESELYDSNYWLAPNRIAMQEGRVNPGEIASFVIRSTTPNVDDMFREYFQPVIEGVKWLETPEETAIIDLYSGYQHGAAEENLKYFRFSGKFSEAAPLLNGEKEIEVDISDQMTYFKIGDRVIAQYKSSTGTFKTPTPLGRFKILNKQDLRIAGAAPHYRMPQWEGFTKWGHGFHALPYLANDSGTFWNEALNHIGQRVSHGCIRLLPEDAKDFYSLTEVGVPIVIHN